MKSNLNFKLLTTCIGFAGLVLNATLWGDDASTQLPGISATKPEKGPFVAIDGGKGGYMVPYTQSFERTNITFEMIPIPGGDSHDRFARERSWA